MGEMVHETKNSAKPPGINCQNAMEIAVGTRWPVDYRAWQSQLQLKKSLKKTDPLCNYGYDLAMQ